PVQMYFPRPRPAGDPGPIPYHVYYHPTSHDTVGYPYGKDKDGGQPYVMRGYRHLMSETFGSVQHYYAKRRVVYVVPVGSTPHQFGEAGTALGIWTLLCELTLALHVANRATYANFRAQPVGRVAVSGFSAGGVYMLSALTNRSSALGQSFVQNS